jgi:hypothetical protein
MTRFGRLVRAGRALVLLVVCLSLAACGGESNPRVTIDNVDKVRMGMTVRQIEDILGPGEEIQPRQVPAFSSPGLAKKWLRWQDDDNRVYVGFENGKAITLSSQIRE